MSPNVIKVDSKKQMSSRNRRDEMKHSHQSSLKSVEEDIRSSGNSKSRNHQYNYSESRLGSPKGTKRSVKPKKVLISPPYHPKYNGVPRLARPDSARGGAREVDLKSSTSNPQMSQNQKYLGNANSLKHIIGRNPSVKERTTSQVCLGSSNA